MHALTRDESIDITQIKMVMARYMPRMLPKPNRIRSTFHIPPSTIYNPTMRVLILGGTGLISVGIIKHLLARNADIAMFNRGKRESNVDPKVKQLTGDRNDFDVFERRFANERFDVVIDMIAFRPQHASSSIRAFRGR